MESQRRGLRGTVIDVRGPDDEARHAGQRHDVPVVPLDHMRQELLDQQEMRDVVDVKGRADLRFGLFENGFAVPDSRIVDQHRRVPDVSADGASDGGDVGGGGHVGFVEGDVRLPFGLGVCRRWGFQVEYNDFDASLCELACDQSSDSAGSAGYQNCFSGPVPGAVKGPVVQAEAREQSVQSVGESEGDEGA
jgi:hypothetical protein